jgi:hypothetical protein
MLVDAIINCPICNAVLNNTHYGNWSYTRHCIKNEDGHQHFAFDYEILDGIKEITYLVIIMPSSLKNEIGWCLTVNFSTSYTIISSEEEMIPYNGVIDFESEDIVKESQRIINLLLKNKIFL